MLLYTDILTGDELFSDAYDVTEVPGAFEVDCQMITVGAVDVDTGANQSAEEVEEALDDAAETVNNLVYSFRLTQTSFDKKSYMSYIKGYMKDLEAKLKELNKPEEEIAEFKKNAAVLVKKILGGFKDYEFYIGEKMDPSGMVALLNYREDGVTPYFTFFKDGVKEQKL
ncbi:Translationally-controlled tumor protein [Coemansia sp. RSA 486]|nr:Translationally-controlled tumor protein [Coemansia sp. RSA 486]KAJ2230284.1 Translationally-controlled tumor protein [Coemansia sp. RSA 485]